MLAQTGVSLKDQWEENVRWKNRRLPKTLRMIYAGDCVAADAVRAIDFRFRSTPSR